MASVMTHPVAERLAAARSVRRPLVFAHRGYSEIEVENTLPAFAAAVAIGSHGIELDVQLSRDGEVVVFHDRDLARLAEDRRAIREVDAAELRRIEPRRASGVESVPDDRRTRLGGEESPHHRGVPHLAEVFGLLAPGTLLDIELKSYDRSTRHILVRRTLEIVYEARATDRVFISSFDPWLIRAVRMTDPEIPTALIFSDDHEVPWVLRRGFGLQLSGATIAKPSVKHLLDGRKAGRDIYLVWTIKTNAEVDSLASHGASGLITNDPAAVLERLAAKK